MSLFLDRRHAGRVLAAAMSTYAGRRDLLVLALPRGGVPVAFEVAQYLEAPLDVLVVRKLGAPGHEEYGVGAIASGGVRVVNDEAVARLGISKEAIDSVVAREAAELQRREQAYRGDRPPLDVSGRTVVLVDDGLATGFTMRAAAMGLRQQGPARVIVAVPVAAPSSCEEMEAVADQVVCARAPEPFYAVGAWYEDFTQTTDDEVRALLRTAEREQQQRSEASAPAEGP